jgi:hypothetical protein
VKTCLGTSPFVVWNVLRILVSGFQLYHFLLPLGDGLNPSNPTVLKPHMGQSLLPSWVDFLSHWGQVTKLFEPQSLTQCDMMTDVSYVWLKQLLLRSRHEAVFQAKPVSKDQIHTIMNQPRL